MSAVLAHEQIDSVVADLELLKDIRRAMADLSDAEIGHGDRVSLSISCGKQPVCFVHGMNDGFLPAIALKAMEREVKSRLASKAIEVEEVAA